MKETFLEAWEKKQPSNKISFKNGKGREILHK